MDISQLPGAANREAAQVQQIVQLIEAAGWKDNPRILAQVRLAQRTGDWKSVLDLLRLRFRNARQLHPFESVPSAAEVAGEIPIGRVLLPDGSLGPYVGLDAKLHLSRHGIIAGPPGKGKTWTAKSLAIQWHYYGARSLIVDPDRQFVDLPVFLPRGECLVFDVAKGKFKRNFLQPLPQGTFAENESRLRAVVEEIWVGPGGGNILSELELEMGGRQGLFTMSELLERLKALRPRMRGDFRRSGYLEGVISPISDIVNHLRAGYDVLEGFPLDELLQYTLVLDVRDLAPDIAVFVNAEFSSAVGKYTLRTPSDHPLLVIWDESQRILKAAGHAATVRGEPVMFEFFRGARKRTTGVFVMAHRAAEVVPDILGNVATHIYFQTSDGPSIETIARAHSLTDAQKRFIPEIPDRCVLMKHPNFPKPFLVRIADLSLNHDVAAEQVADMVKPIIATLKWTPSPTATATPAETNSKPRVEQDTASHNASNVERSDVNAVSAMPEVEKQTKTSGRFLDAELLDYFRAVARDLLVQKTARYKQLKLSAGRGDALSAELIKLGLIEEIKVGTGKRGGQIVLLEITKAGRELLARHNISVNVPRGKGGLKHSFFQHIIADWWTRAQRGTATIEDTTSGKAVDVVLVRGDERIAVEVLVNGIDKELRNVEADLVDYQQLWLVAESVDQLKRLKRKVQGVVTAEQLARLRFETIGKFLLEKNAQAASE